MGSGTRRIRGSLAVLIALFVLAGALPASAANTFTDDNGSVFEADIEYIAALGVTKGCTTTKFCPDALVTRAEMAAFFVRLFGYPASTINFFTDDNGYTLEPEINAFRAAAVTLGCTTTKYCPDAPVTREQMAAFFARALSLHTFKTVLFTDVTGGYFHGEINAIRGVGITLGCTATKYCPTGSVTRGEMAAFLARAHKLGTKRAPAVDITDPANLATFITHFDSGSGHYQAAVTFGAVAPDPNGGTPTYRWTSSVQGLLGTGQANIFDLVIPSGADNSQPNIVVRATDSDGLFTEDQVQVKLVLPSP